VWAKVDFLNQKARGISSNRFVLNGSVIQTREVCAGYLPQELKIAQKSNKTDRVII
jgi:hypothetical protein